MQTESAVELFARLKPRCKLVKLPEVLFPKNTAPSHSFVDISGPSNTGKTILLTDIMARCLLDSFQEKVRFRILFIDFDHQLDFPRLSHTVTSLLKKNGLEHSDEAVAKLLQCLDVIPCHSLDDLFLSLHLLESSVFQNPRSAVFIDSLTTLYWYTRFRYPSVKPHENEIFSRIARTISRISASYGISFFMTRQQLYRDFKNFKTGAPLDFMGETWRKLPTMHIVTGISEDKTTSLKIVAGENSRKLSMSIHKDEVTFH